jgi:hypothetical protein
MPGRHCQASVSSTPDGLRPGCPARCDTASERCGAETLPDPERRGRTHRLRCTRPVISPARRIEARHGSRPRELFDLDDRSLNRFPLPFSALYLRNCRAQV